MNVDWEKADAMFLGDPLEALNRLAGVQLEADEL
jgi:hypothetical protein